MRALLTPEIAPRMGIVLFRPGSELMPLFMQGRVLLEPEPERYSSFASGAVPAASQPLADDPAVRAVFRNEAVIRRAGGVECLESWLLREKGCQWPHSGWHSENMTTMRHAPGAIRLCWHCDNQLRDQFTERLESMATDNCARWVLSVVRRDLGFDDSHVVTMPELCWWLVRNDLADALPESAARKALRLPKPVVPSVTRESDLVPSVPATSIIQDKAKKVLALKVDPESPESFMLRPKRRRWVNEKYTRWVKTQPCACCGKPADDPHHLIGHGQGGMGTKAHDLFVLPLCRKHHDELHADTVVFEEKYGSQLELIFRFIDRALTIGVLTYWRKWRTSMNLEALPKYYSPKSPKLSDDAPATGTGCLTITDVMAAQGMVQSKAPLGLALFLAKVGVQDPQFAIEGLLNYAMALDNPTLNKLSEEIRLQIIPYLVSFAFADYSRSAASKARCEHCSGTGFYNVLREVVKHYRRGESVIKEEWVKELCQHCHGKGEASTACRGCKGKGIVLDEKRTRFHGVPVYKICGRCNGNRFSRLPTTLARRHVQKLVPDLTDYQWYKGYADVIGKLVTKCWQEEAYAEAQLRKVTR